MTKMAMRDRRGNFLRARAAGRSACASHAQADPLPIVERRRRRRQAIVDVRGGRRRPRASPKFVPPEERIATFDQDGTLWVEQPIYSQVMYCLERVPAVVKAKPELASVEPFKTVMSGNREAIAKLSKQDLEKILVATLTGMPVDTVQRRRLEMARSSETSALEAAVHGVDLRADAGAHEIPASQRLQDVYRHRRGSGLRARLLARRCTAFRPSRWSAPQEVRHSATTRAAGRSSRRMPKLLLNDDAAGKPEGIHLVIGRRPHAAFGNSAGDRQMLDTRARAMARA